MKKKLWMGIMLAVAFCANVSVAVFADEKAQTNCIGDTSGKTNCMAMPEGADSDSATPVVIENDVLNFGRIVEAGRRYSQVLKVRNASKSGTVVRVEVTAYDSDVLDGQQKKVTDWVAFGGGKRKFDLAAGAELQINVRLMVPTDVKGGTYYARIKVSDDAGDQFVTVKADVALDGFNYAGKVASQAIGFFNFGEKATASASVKNEGTAGFTAHYEVQYKNAFGLPEWKHIAEENREVLPGAEETFEISEESGKIGYGIFTVEQKISYVNSEGRQVEAILSHAVVNLPWWGLAIGVGVIVLIIAIIVAVKTRGKKKAEAERAAAKKSTGKAGRKSKRTAEAEESEDDSDDDFWDE